MKLIAKQILDKRANLMEYKLKELTDHGNASTFYIESLDKKFILRISERKESLRNNYLALKILNGKLAPKVFCLDKYKKFYFSVETFMPGVKRDLDIKHFKQMTNYLKKIHNYKRDKCGWLNNPSKLWKNYFFKYHINNYKERFKLKVKSHEKYFSLIKQRFPKSLGKFSLLHGDYSFTNSLFFKNKVYFFDFEDSFFGEKEYDLAMIYFMEFLPNYDFINKINIQGYDKEKILFYGLCIGIRKVALSKDKKHCESRLKRLNMIYDHLK